MILPTSYLAALLLVLAAAVCWGTWPNTFLKTRKWRFELYSLDFALGAMLAATALVLTIGSLGTELTFQDNLLISGKRVLAMAFVAGGVFNLGNMLFLGSLSVGGMSVAFWIAAGSALVFNLALSTIFQPQGACAWLIGGAILLAGSVAAMSMAFKGQAALKDEERKKNWQSKTRQPPRTGMKAVGLALASGLFLAASYPLILLSVAGSPHLRPFLSSWQGGELGLRAYTTGFLFVLGLFLSTPILALVFMNVPVKGKPIGITNYFQGNLAEHLMGLAGGALFSAGLMAYFGGTAAHDEPLLQRGMASALGHLGLLIGVLWGLLYWKEFAGATGQTKRFLRIGLVLLVTGLGALSVGRLAG